MNANFEVGTRENKYFADTMLPHDINMPFSCEEK